MPDRVIGIAVLEVAKTPHKLHVLCHRDGKTPLREVIDVYPAGTLKPCDPAWAISVQGNTLHVTPSLHVRVQAGLPESQEWTTWFHNEGAWDVEFVVYPADEGAWSYFRKINGLEHE